MDELIKKKLMKQTVQSGGSLKGELRARRSSIVLLEKGFVLIIFQVQDGGARVGESHHGTFEFSFTGDCGVRSNWYRKIEISFRIS